MFNMRFEANGEQPDCKRDDTSANNTNKQWNWMLEQNIHTIRREVDTGQWTGKKDGDE